jgi:hypothetical protein
MKYIKHIIIVIACITIYSCKVTYGFTGANTGDSQTFQVNFFPNNARLIEPGIDIQFTNALQDLIQNQTSLELVNSGGDLTYEGEIVEYRISPTTATADNRAAQNRLTIGINLRFYDKNDEEKDFEQRFSFFFDFAGSAQLTGSQKDTAIETIFERITQDVFNESLANW